MDYVKEKMLKECLSSLDLAFFCADSASKDSDNDISQVVALINKSRALLRKTINQNETLTSDFFKKIVYKVFDTDEKEMKDTKCRNRKLVYARQMYMFVLHLFFGLSQKKSAEFYLKNHATVIHAINNVFNMYATDSHFRLQTEPIWALWEKHLELPAQIKKHRK